VGTGRGQAGKTFKEDKRWFRGKWAGRGRQAGLREGRLMGRKRTGMHDRTLREDRRVGRRRDEGRQDSH
jgi:hypothetical protein